MAGDERGAAQYSPSKAGKGQLSMCLVSFRRLSSASCPSPPPAHSCTHFQMKKQRQVAIEVIQ